MKTVKNKKALLCAVIDTGDAEALRILLDMKYIASTKVCDELIERAAAPGTSRGNRASARI